MKITEVRMLKLIGPRLHSMGGATGEIGKIIVRIDTDTGLYGLGEADNFLGVADAITNRLEMKNGYATGKLLRPVVAGPGKARIIADDAREHGDDLAECQAYSASFSDVPMLSVVGHPQCINPDPKLARLAKAYHWPILDIERAVPGDPERLAPSEKY